MPIKNQLSIQNNNLKKFASVWWFLHVLFFVFYGTVSKANINSCMSVFEKPTLIDPVSYALAQNRIRFDDTESFNHSEIQFEYFSQTDQIFKYYYNGSLWTMEDNIWYHVGNASYKNGKVFEYDRNGNLKEEVKVDLQMNHFPDIRPLNEFPDKYKIFKKQEADIYYPNAQTYRKTALHVLQVSSALGSFKHELLVQVPKSSEQDQMTRAILDILMDLPHQYVTTINAVRMNPEDFILDTELKKIHPAFSKTAANAMSIGSNFGVIDFYKVGIESLMTSRGAGEQIIRHELGHLIANAIFGNSDPNSVYKILATVDSHPVSDYGQTSWAEDFAEGIEKYLRSHAGLLDPIAMQNLSNRFSFFHDIFRGSQERSPQSINKTNKHIKVFIKMIDLDLTNNHSVKNKSLSQYLKKPAIVIFIPDLKKGIIFSL